MRKILNILYNLIVININENIFLQVTIMYILLTGSRYGHYIPFEWAGNLIFFLVNIIFESRTAWYSQIAISLLKLFNNLWFRVSFERTLFIYSKEKLSMP